MRWANKKSIQGIHLLSMVFIISAPTMVLGETTPNERAEVSDHALEDDAALRSSEERLDSVETQIRGIGDELRQSQEISGSTSAALEALREQVEAQEARLAEMEEKSSIGDGPKFSRFNRKSLVNFVMTYQELDS